MSQRPRDYFLSLPLILATLVVLEPSSAQADAQEPHKSASITISPVHLALPVVEISAEFALAPNMSFAGILGAGTVETVGATEDIKVFEVGAQFRYYLTGNFDTGLHLGGEAIYLGASTGDNEDISAKAAGLAVGPLVGYKWTANFGLVLEAQGGVEYVAVRAETTDGANRAEQSDVIPLINLNAGFAF